MKPSIIIIDIILLVSSSIFLMVNCPFIDLQVSKSLEVVRNSINFDFTAFFIRITVKSFLHFMIDYKRYCYNLLVTFWWGVKGLKLFIKCCVLFFFFRKHRFTLSVVTTMVVGAFLCLYFFSTFLVCF